MLTINASSLRAPLSDAAATPTSGSDSSSDPAGFSSLLRQSQAAAAPPKPATTSPKSTAPSTRDDAAARTADRTQDAEPPQSADHDTEASAEANESATANDATSRTRAQAKAKPRADYASRTAKPASEATTSDAKLADKAAPANAAAAATAPSAQIDPNVAQWLAAQQRQTSAAKAGADTQATSDAAANALVDTNATIKGARADDTAIGADPKDKAGHCVLRFAAAADAAGLEAARIEPRAADVTAASTAHAADKADGVPATSLQPAPTAPREAAAPASAAIATPVNAPDFAQTLGVQMSMFAKDGVQQAELHLNPAEMGPVSVQIVMDGTQARIDFGADVAATRHAIEAGLPELASALRDAGFTLAGGGVSQHSNSRGDGGQADGGNTRRSLRPVSDDSVARVNTAARRVVTNGGVDLYA